MTRKTELIRIAARTLAQGGNPISNLQICEALGAKTETEKARIRTRLTDMVRTGELTRIQTGLYEYNFKYRLRSPQEAKGYCKIWRFVRQQNRPWSVADCALLTGQSKTHIAKYINWLKDEEYLEIAGKNGNTFLLIATKKALATPETPVAPQKESNPFEKELAAGAKIIRLLLCGDLYSPSTAKEIVKESKILLQRFENNITVTSEE